MRKQWAVRVQLDMCANDEKVIVVKTNLEKKACELAEKQAKNAGAFHVKVLSCVPI